MKIIIVLLCLALVGCTTVAKRSKAPCPAAKKDLVTVDQKELDHMISVFSEEIKKNSRYSGAYYNRAVAYYYKKDYDKSWQDVHKVQKLSTGLDPSLANLIERLQKASGRDK